MNEKNFDVAIFGNGLTAKVMCLVALHCGVNFINIRKKEKKENKPDDIRSLALSSASKNMLKILGANPISQPVKKMIVFEGGVSNDKIKGSVIFDSKELHEQIAYICEYSVINKSLEDNLSLDSKNSIAEVPISIIDDGNYSKIVFKNKNIIKIKNGAKKAPFLIDFFINNYVIKLAQYLLRFAFRCYLLLVRKKLFDHLQDLEDQQLEQL